MEVDIYNDLGAKPIHKQKKIGLIIRHAPYANDLAQEALDAVLASSVYGQILTLIFIGDGVFQLLKKQNSQAIQKKSFEKQLAAFALYDIDRIFVCEESLQERGVHPAQLSIKSDVLNQNNISRLLREQDTILPF